MTDFAMTIDICLTIETTKRWTTKEWRRRLETNSWSEKKTKREAGVIFVGHLFGVGDSVRAQVVSGDRKR